MSIKQLFPLLCPMDGEILFKKEKSFYCLQNGHTYDLAKEGYVYLLPVQQKGSLQPGDTKEMVESRFQFLKSGYYSPLAEKLCELVFLYKNKKNEIRILDAGCGDGYYLHHLSAALLSLSHTSRPSFFLGGFDISKWAIRKAAQQKSNVMWFVASNKNIPVPENSIDLLLCFFGFPVWESFKKIQAPQGKVFLLDPGPNHLRELREVIYPEVFLNNERNLEPAFENGYELVKEEKQEFQIQLQSTDEILHLLKMTPHFYKVSQDRYKSLQSIQRLKVTVEVSWKVLNFSGSSLKI